MLQRRAILRRARWLRETEENPGQRRPPGEWRVWFAQGPRGSGKTRGGAEAMADLILSSPPGDYGCVAPNSEHAKAIMVEHRRSGLLKVLGPAVVNWNRSKGELYVANGSVVYCDGADDGALGIQGKELRACWCDEIGLWYVTKKRTGEEVGGLQAWNESIEFAVREEPALIIATGTPKGNKGIVKQLVNDPDVVITHPSLLANERNLAASVVAGWRRKWAGTRLGKQELEGLVISEVVGALWTDALISRNRVTPRAADELPDVMRRRKVVAIDPAASKNPEADETGIMVGETILPGRDAADALDVPFMDVEQALVTEDLSGHYSPTEWATVAITAFHEGRADLIVAERNNGGEMVESTIHAIDPNVPVKLVWASKSKQTRAEPISALYEKDRIHHVGNVGDDEGRLESEMTTWVPGEDSPNRMDALVWLMTELFLEGSGENVFPEPLQMPVGLDGSILDASW